ncbi:hypothetical protein BGZ63DRAFT_415910 [Mariannaea sp. PMI_226]|nr:hypothetical protein BGZ63DRAFT_415910 [Mariannaea sp. PMI_226]
MIQSPTSAPTLARTTMKRADTSECGDGRVTKKRSRGRPRLETTDETAAERRRTQIRLAQRAYRNRKDTAIDALKKRVKELEQVNEDMGHEFMNLSDFFLSQGMLQTSPEAAMRLNEATRRFLALSRKASDECVDDCDGDDHAADQKSDQLPTARQDKIKRALSDSASTSTSSMSGDAQSTPNTLLSHEDISLSGGRQISVTFQQLDPLSQVSVDSVTQPSIKDSSFPVLDSQANIPLFNSSIYTQSPFDTLPAPISYGARERSFGRRFQRETVEAGLALALMENPPPERYMAVFSFCLQFESKEDIIRRLTLVLHRTREESLNNWKYPFTNLGGAGTWLTYPDSADKMSYPDSIDKLVDGNPARGEVPIGNHGLAQPFKQSQATGLSIGPFSEEVEYTRDLRIDYRMRMLYPGFEGDFFDSDEVDTYLHQQGIIIPEGKDFVEAEIDIEAFERPPELPPRDFGAKRQRFFRENETGNGADLMTLYSSDFQNPGNAWQTSTTTTVQGSIALGGSFTPAGLDPQLSTFSAELSGANGQQFGQGLRSFDSVTEVPWNVWEPAPVPASKKTKVVIDVNRLVKELVDASVCLGRSPGIRPKDVQRAVKLSIT